MIQRRQQPRFALEPREPSDLAQRRRGRILIATSRPSLVIARPVDFAHAAHAEQRENLKRPELAAGEIPVHDAHILAPAQPLALRIRYNPVHVWTGQRSAWGGHHARERHMRTS